MHKSGRLLFQKLHVTVTVETRQYNNGWQLADKVDYSQTDKKLEI